MWLERELKNKGKAVKMGHKRWIWYFTVMCAVLVFPIRSQARMPVVIQDTGSSIIFDLGMESAVQLGVDRNSYGNATNQFTDLKLPAQVIKQGDFYFIVDCYNNQVLYSRNFGEPLKNWKVMTGDVYQPHSIASDGQVYLVVDTENNRVLVFEWQYGRFQNTQKFENVGKRPHYITYDAESASFYVWSSLTGEMYILRRNPQNRTMYAAQIRQITELNGYYVRSFTIVGDRILFPSGNNAYIIIADKNTLEVRERYPVTPEIAGMAYMMPIGSYYYLTVSSDLYYDQSAATIIRTTDLRSLSTGSYEDLHYLFDTRGIPYYIDYINGMYYMTNHGISKSIWYFRTEDDQIRDVGKVY